VDGNGNDATLSANHAQLINLDGVRDCVRTGNMSLVNTFGVAAWVNSAVIYQGAYRRIVENSFASHFWLGTDAAGTRVLVPLLPGTKLLRRRQLWVRVGTGGADQHHLQLSDWPRLRMGAPALARDIGRVRA